MIFFFIIFFHNAKIQLYINLSAECQSRTSSHHVYYSNTITGLQPGDKIPVTVTMGTCKASETIEILNIPTVKKFNSATETKCFYDEICNGKVICNKCLEKAAINGSFNQSGWSGAFSKCSYNTICPDLEKGGGATFAPKTKAYDKKWMRLGEYIVLLQAAVQASIISQAQADSYLQFFDDPTKICSRVHVCMANLNPLSNLLAGLSCQGKGPNTTTAGCFVMECGCLFKTTIPFCLDDIMPKWVGDFKNLDIKPCDLRLYSVHEMLSWESEIIAKYPTTYPGSTLAKFLESVKKDPDLFSKRACARVSFCQNDFRFLNSDIKTIDCTPNFAPTDDPDARNPGYKPCTIVPPINKSEEGYDIAVCKRKNGGKDLDFKKHKKKLPTAFFTGSNTASKEAILDPYNGTGKLSHFGIAMSDEVIMPRGFVETEQGGMKYYDYTVNEESGTFYNTENIYFSFEDAIYNTLTYINKVAENKYMVNFEGENGLWYHALSSITNLKDRKSVV